MNNFSAEFEKFLYEIIDSEVFWKLNYYLRSMKKAPHGGVFYIATPNYFLQKYTVRVYEFFIPSKKMPKPILHFAEYVKGLFYNKNLDIEELINFCFTPEGSPFDADKLYIASCGNVLCSTQNVEEKMRIIAEAMNGRIKFIDNFDINTERLFCLFGCLLIEKQAISIKDVNEILNHEIIAISNNKYGLSDVTNATFDREGFVINKKYYLYNIFLDTSINSSNSKVPYTIEILQRLTSEASIFMRCDENLSVALCDKVSLATIDMQKWRGITLRFGEIDKLVKAGKEIIVHFDPKTGHKVLIYIKKADNNKFYHINVEELWNPEILDDKDIVLINYLHGTYYPTSKTFEHIDYSINQYKKEIYIDKFKDSVLSTSIPIDKYGDEHYKIWCVKGTELSVNVWVELVIATLDVPFRKVFMEMIDGAYLRDC